METKTASQPVALVTGLYRGKFSGLEPLTVNTPLTRDEVRRNPVFYELTLNPQREDENLIIDVIYDNLSPMRLPDLRRGTDIPRGVRYWPDWFDIPPYDEMHDIDGRRVYPRAQGIHTVQVRTGRRKFAQIGRARDFSPENGGYTSPVFEIAISPGGMTMMEDPKTPVFLGLTDTEWHAFGYGLKEGFKFWKRKPLAWDEATRMAMLPDTEKLLSPEIIEAVVKKYHYYIIGFDLPEDFALLGCVIYLGATNLPLLMKVGFSFFGFSG